MEEVKHTPLPEKIFAVNYAGYFDFSPDGKYSPSLLNVVDFPNAEQIVDEIARRYNSYYQLQDENEKLRKVLAEAGRFMRALLSSGALSHVHSDRTDAMSAGVIRIETLLSTLNEEKKV